MPSSDPADYCRERIETRDVYGHVNHGFVSNRGARSEAFRGGQRQ